VIGQEPDYDSPINRGSHLLQGRGGSRRRAEPAPSALSGEARERPLDPDILETAIERDRRQVAGHSPEVGAGFGLLAWFSQVHQRSAYLNRKLAASGNQ